MSVTKLGLIYSISQNRIRRIINPTYDDSEIDKFPPGDGEALLIINNKNAPRTADGAFDVPALDVIVALEVGGQLKSHTCAVVQDGVVTRLILADPSIDSVEGCLLIQTDTAQVGDKYADGVFTPQAA